MTAVYEFNSAIVRTPGRSVINGLRADDRGNPTYEGVKEEHEAYVQALRQAGVEVTVLPQWRNFRIRSLSKTRHSCFTKVLFCCVPVRLRVSARRRKSSRFCALFLRGWCCFHLRALRMVGTFLSHRRR